VEIEMNQTCLNEYKFGLLNNRVSYIDCPGLDDGKEHAEILQFISKNKL
jgi:hypothetical protein